MFTREEALHKVEGASPARLFGPPTPDRRAEAKRLYRALAGALHPDRVAPDDTRAHRASADLTRLYHDWRHAEPVTLRTTRGAYRLTDPHAVGSVANLYRTDGRHVVKLARNPKLNPLLHAEWHALRALDRFTDHHRWLKPYYPTLHDTGDVERGQRAFTVLEPLIDGFVTLTEIKAAYPHGLDGRDYAWMHRRLLRALAGAHQAGLVHGAVTTDNVLVHPEQHGIVLVGWSFAVEPGQPPLATDRTTTYPPEVTRKKPLTPATDVHMAHQLMLDMVAHNEKRQRTFARGCMRPDPADRPDTADLLDEYDQLLEDTYGARVFRPFALPRRGA